MDFSSFLQLVANSRTVRRFKSEVSVNGEILRELIDLARLTPSSKNMQPLKYILVNETQSRVDVFSCLNWAKALTKWGGPTESERPGAYIIILGDSQVAEKFSVDPGIVAQTMRLGAQTRGLGGCIIASIDRDMLREKLSIDSRFEILLILALGIPDEKVVIEPLPENGSIDYWRDNEEVHHVPKRSVEELVVCEFLSA